MLQILQDIGFINGELKYVAIKFRSVMKKRLPFSIGSFVQGFRNSELESNLMASLQGTEVRDMLREWTNGQRGLLTELRAAPASQST